MRCESVDIPNGNLYLRDHYVPADFSLIPDGLTIQRSTLIQQVGFKRLLNCRLSIYKSHFATVSWSSTTLTEFRMSWVSREASA
jgi:hypothetical protein